MSLFRDLLAEALEHFAEVGFTSESDLQDWVFRLRAALEAELPTDRDLRGALSAALEKAFGREMKSGVFQRVPGVAKFTIDRIAPRLRAELDRRIFAGLDLIKLNRKAAVEKTLQRFTGWVSSVPHGGAAKVNLRETNSEIRKPTSRLKFEARRVAIDQSHKLVSAISAVAAMQEGAIGAIWHDRGEHDHGYDARPEHLARSGKLFLVRDSWAMEEGLVKKGGHEYVDEVDQPAEKVYCFPGSTKIQFAELVSKGYRRWYSGELTEVVTASGKTLRATPNHPILTVNGWIACGELKEGDDLLEISEKSIDAFVSESTQDEAVPTIAQIFGALNEPSTLHRIAGSSSQFHGDGSEGDVDIVGAARPLTFDYMPASSERVDEIPLAESDKSRSTRGALQLLSDTRSFRGTGDMGGLNAISTPFASAQGQVEASGLLDRANLVTGIAHFIGEELAGDSKSLCENLNGFPTLMEPSGFGNVNRLGETPRVAHSSSSLFYSEHDGSRSDSIGEGEFPERLAKLVALTKVVSVKRCDFSGQVYNLQTANGYYVADGIIAHNCSCFWEYLTSPRDLPNECLTEKGRAWVKR